MLVSQISAEVGAELVGVRLQERRQARAAGFLLALEQHGDRDRQPARHRLPGAAGLDEGHQLALVVGGAAAADRLAAVGAGLDRRARTDRGPRAPAGRPAARRSGRRRAPRCPGADRSCPTTIGWPVVSRTAASKPIEARSAACHSAQARVVGGVGRVGRDRLDPQHVRTAARGPRRGRRRCAPERHSRSDMAVPPDLVRGTLARFRGAATAPPRPGQAGARASRRCASAG